MKRKQCLLLLILLLTGSIQLSRANTPRPVTPDASPEAKALLNYIYSVNGEKVLSGQHGIDETEYVKSVTGRYPAVKGFDLIHENRNEQQISSAIEWWQKGGIPTVMWHWGAPGKGPGYENSKKKIDIDRCFLEGTEENKAMWADLKRIADHLTVLRDAKVPVLWRPLHECDGDWFWYGKGTSAQFCRLWRTMFDYFTKERKLDNLIWVLCHTGDPSASFDPGEEYYDIAGADSYNTERVRKAMYDKTCLIHGSERPIAYHECGTIPDPDLCRKANVNWSWWMLWSREYAYNHDKDELKRIYNHDKVLTLDELPPIMDYLPDFPNVSVTAAKGAFPLSKARICTDPEDFKVVGICAGMLADDIGLVCGHKAATAAISDLSSAKGSAPIVIAGTIGHSRLIDGLIAKGLLDVNDIKGKWESFVVTTVENPADKSPMLVIAGSDRRGTAFGLTSMSRAIGVSPWYWWADVTPVAKSALYVEPGRFRQGEPSVQYRGIFINDERFGGWAKWVENTFDKESGQVGPKVYRKVFELLLRLKGNYLWPAMHNGSKAFNANPENGRLADDYAIVMGSSHCEQMLRNNEDEWKNAGTYGDFNYITNRKTMQDYWEARVKANGKYENTYTLGLRGIHDYPMEGANTTAERTKLMQQAINDQRAILKRNIKKPLEEIPQVLCTYEEVLDAYHHGLKVPDDVTMLWCDDKHGFTRNLCNPTEMKRKGGSGIYYHLSYHGDPASWIWLSPLSPSLVSNELTKAYTFGVRKIWVFNVGDIKPAEKEISFVMDLAWNISRWTPEKAHTYIRQWAAETFGSEFASEIATLQDGYYRLQASGKDSHVYFVNYPESEIDLRINEYRDLSTRALALSKMIPAQLRDAYFELVSYPIRGAAMLNEYQLLSRRSLARATIGDSAVAMKYADRATRMFHELNDWTRIYNKEVNGGKWDNFFCWVPYHWHKSVIMDAPVASPEMLESVSNSPSPRFLPVNAALSAEGVEIEAETDGELPLWIEALTPTRNFSKAREDNIYCRVNIGDDSFEAAATPINNIWHAPFVGPMWSKVGSVKLKKGKNRLNISDLKDGARIDSIFIGIYPPFPHPSKEIVKADSYVSKKDSEHGKLVNISGLGYNDGLEVQPFDTPSYELKDIDKAPYADFEVSLKAGKNQIEFRTLPTLHIYEGRDARYAVSLGNGKPEVFSIHAGDFSAEWRWNVLRGYASRTVEIEVAEDGRQNLRFYFMDPGIVLQEIHVK